ncbi:MAG TPA: magnesium chelatase domain-containing protein, partial [Devosia sp.]|nr:magnesium chelatase domain-containing protein [Devosia sp.]
LETRCGVRIGANDIYLNVAGGLKVNEPAADLAVAAALISSLSNSPLPPEAVYFGEISLAGGVRPVVHAALRLREAQKLGFKSAVTGKLGAGDGASGLAVAEYSELADLIGRIAANGRRGPAD